MPLDLPSAVEVTLSPDDGATVTGVLVALDLKYAGRYYYGTHLGLSDRSGRVRLERAALERDFAEDQHLFPMDYRVSLAECDAEALVRVEGGEQFAARRTADIGSPLVSPEAAARWREARNEEVQPTAASAWLDRPDPDGVVRVRVALRRAAI
jgi:hypothetical protein